MIKSIKIVEYRNRLPFLVIIFTLLFSISDPISYQAFFADEDNRSKETSLETETISKSTTGFIIIDFESEPGPDGHLGTADDVPLSESTYISSQFDSLGINFSLIGGGHPFIATEGPPTVGFESGDENQDIPAVSGVNTLTDGNVSVETASEEKDIAINFTNPVDSVDLTLIDFRYDCNSSAKATAGATVSLNAYDDQNNIIASDSYTTTGEEPVTFLLPLGVEGNGIMRIELVGTSVDCGIAIDDLRYAASWLPNPCDLDNLPLFYQGSPSTPNNLPNTPEWYDDTYGNYEEGDTYNTVGRWGCNTSSNAMIVEFYDRCYYSVCRTDPGVLNSWLRENEGYTPPPNHGVIYSKVIAYAKSLGIGLTIAIDGRNDQKMNQHLDNNNPAMVKVLTPYGTHFVSVKGRTQVSGTDTYEINDPIWGDTTLHEHYNNTYSTAYYYTANPYPSNLSHLQVSAFSPIHLVITDPLGRKSGYDPRTDTTWDEIPNAGYTIDEIAEPDGEVLPETKILLITHPMEGDYQIEAIGYDSGSYEVAIAQLNHFGDPTQVVYTGFASEGSSDSIEVDYDPGEMNYLPIVNK